MESSGVGLYATANLINNSCKPNCVQIFIKSKLRILAIKDIKVNEEITICYDDVAKPPKLRHQFLKESYYFDC